MYMHTQKMISRLLDLFFQVKQLYVFQRTPCWVSEKSATVYPDWLKSLFKFYPPLLYMFRLYFYWYRELV